MTKIPQHTQPQSVDRSDPAPDLAPAPSVPTIGGKLGVIVALLRRKEGADLSDMMEATGWQQHSIRGALAGPLKKKRGLQITSDKPGNVRVYRILPEKTAAPKARRRAAPGLAVAKPPV